MDFAFTLVSGFKETAALAAQTPPLLGVSSHNVPKGNFDWEFIDWPFQPSASPSRFQHSLLTQAHKPKLAVAPDIDPDTEQTQLGAGTANERNSLPVSTVLDVADEMDEHAETVIVIPTGPSYPVEDVPDRYRVGVPSSKGFGIEQVPRDLPFSIQQYNAHNGGVHILGGGPSRQADLMELLDDVRSVDSSFPTGRATSQGLVWDGTKMRPREEQPDFLKDKDFAAKVYVTLQTYAHTVGMVNLFAWKGVPRDQDRKLSDDLLRVAMVASRRDLVAMAERILPPEFGWDVRLDGGRIMASTAATNVTDDDWGDFAELLHDFGWRNVTGEVTRGGFIVTADPPRAQPEPSEFDDRPGM